MPFHPARISQIGHFVGDADVVKEIQTQDFIDQLLINAVRLRRGLARCRSGCCGMRSCRLRRRWRHHRRGHLRKARSTRHARRLHVIVQRPAHGHHVITIGRQQRRIRPRRFQVGLHVRWLVKSRVWSCLHGLRHQHRWRAGDRFCFIIHFIVNVTFIAIVLFILALLLPWLFLFLLKSSIPLGRNHCRIHIAHKRHSLLVHRHPARAPNQHILRLQVGVDDTTHPVQVVEADQGVSRYLAHNIQGYALEVVPFDEGEHIGAHCLKHHANVFAIDPEMLEVVYQLHHSRERKLRKQGTAWALLCLLPSFVFAPLGGLG
mmetsp:Transcript_9044/g.19355  ORF Transcript_9044/g.19355 Transcript_9044/m.19355 type:complete len:318 (-) Transcript_9044:342-1295(-)